MEIWQYIVTILTSSTATIGVLYKYFIIDKDKERKKKERLALIETNKSIKNYNLLVRQFNVLSKTHKETTNAIKQLQEEKYVVQKEHTAIIDKYQDRVHKLELELLSKDSIIKLLSSIEAELSHPLWKKDLNGTMIFVNKEYEKWQNVLHEEIRGKTDVEIHGEERGEVYRKNDLDLLKSDYSYYIDINIEVEGYIIIKEKIFSGGVLVYIKGDAYKLPKEIVNKSKNYVR